LIIYHVYYAFMPSITQIWTTFNRGIYSKSIIFKVKNTFEWIVLKWVIKKNFINSSPFALIIINVKILSNFKKKWCTFGKKKKKKRLKKIRTIHFEGLNTLNMKKHFWFVSNFQMKTLQINEKYSQKKW
jgi:hypothetical protein